MARTALDLMVNAVSPGIRAGGQFGGGPLADSTPADLDHYAGGVTRQVHAFLSAGARALRATGGGAHELVVTPLGDRLVP